MEATNYSAEHVTLLLQLLANGLVNGALYAMLAVGFGLVWRTIGIFHVAYGGLYVCCAYCFYFLASSAGLTPALSLFITFVVGGLAGVAVERGFYRHFYRKRASPGAVLIASLGLFVALENLIALSFGNELRVVERAFRDTVHLGPVALTRLQLTELFVGAGVLSGLWLLVRRMRTFKALWAMGDQPELISVLGLPLFRLRTLVFAISTALVAIPASLTTLDLGIDPQTGMRTMLVSAVAVLVGGLHSYGGWVVGALILAVVQSLVMWKLSAQWVDLVTFSLLILILTFRPKGLLARRRRLEEA